MKERVVKVSDADAKVNTDLNHVLKLSFLAMNDNFEQWQLEHAQL